MARFVVALVAMAAAAPALAGEPETVASGDAASPVEQSYRLSDEEVDEVLNEAARARHDGGEESPEGGPEIHGQVGFTIGTGGHRSAFGSAAVPLGDDGMAGFSFETGRYPGYEPYFQPGYGRYYDHYRTGRRYRGF
jgi:hypothetical protein